MSFVSRFNVYIIYGYICCSGQSFLITILRGLIIAVMRRVAYFTLIRMSHKLQHLW